MTPAAEANLSGERTARGAVLFRAKGLCKDFGGVHAVRDISFDIVPASCLP